MSCVYSALFPTATFVIFTRFTASFFFFFIYFNQCTLLDYCIDYGKIWLCFERGYFTFITRGEGSIVGNAPYRHRRAAAYTLLLLSCFIIIITFFFLYTMRIIKEKAVRRDFQTKRRPLGKQRRGQSPQLAES